MTARPIPVDGLRAERRRLDVVKASGVAIGLLIVASWSWILFGNDSGVSDLFSTDTWRRAGDFVNELLGARAEGTPAFLDSSEWWKVAKLSAETVAMSVLATGIAGLAAVLTFLPAARNVAVGELRAGPKWAGTTVFFVVRALYAFSRGVPELVWALIIVFVVSPGILPGALALGVHNFGIVGKLAAEVVENLDPRPARALRAAGASNAQMLLYGVLPQALPQFLTYLLYRWEVIIRTTVVVGFVAAGGLGLEFRLNMSFRHYDDVALLLLAYLVLVVGVDLAAAGLRRLAR